ncbi:YheC/YheD family protein [Melghirimyces profundicolus]|uniref:YheC/YheD family protein n=1 Tax=Melghirimyces profundicolus TaxID=1242148 RepID=UPI001FE7EA67|nr:YheC/YheD family protein [Melghirimyces profundicolus]
MKKSKWKQARLLRKRRETAKCFPETAPYSKANLKSFLNRHPAIYIKPDSGGQGRGIFRVTRVSGKGYRIEGARKRIHCKNLEDVHRTLWSSVQYRNHIIQQGIRSVTPRGCSFDIRVHVQRLGGEWVIGGMVGKLGSASGFVTNRHRGGRPVSLNELFANHLGLTGREGRRVRNRLKHLARETAKAMNQGYRGWPEYGIDIGMKPNGTLWVFEANITPGIAVFAALKDQRPYRGILRNRRLRRQKNSV